MNEIEPIQAKKSDLLSESTLKMLNFRPPTIQEKGFLQNNEKKVLKIHELNSAKPHIKGWFYFFMVMAISLSSSMFSYVETFFKQFNTYDTETIVVAIIAAICMLLFDVLIIYLTFNYLIADIPDRFVYAYKNGDYDVSDDLEVMGYYKRTSESNLTVVFQLQNFLLSEDDIITNNIGSAEYIKLIRFKAYIPHKKQYKYAYAVLAF